MEPRSETAWSRWRTWWGCVGIGLLLLLGWGIRFHNLTEVLVEGRFYFVDADCYSRMSRVRLVSDHPGTVVRLHTFENWPQGVVSHATSPLDYVIYALSLPVRWMTPSSGRWAVLQGQPLDVAGALVGPLLGVFTCGAVALGLGFFQKTRPGVEAYAALLLAAGSPALVHATVFGRPDHQAALVALFAVVWSAEKRMQAGAGAAWAWAGGLALGMALWVSWFEPVIVGLLVAGCAWMGGSHTWTRALRGRWCAGMAAMVLVGVLVDGLRVALPKREFWEVLQRWAGTIGELQGLDSFFSLFRWSGGLLLGLPVCAVLWFRTGRARAALAWALQVVVLAALTMWHIRWSPYFALGFVFLVPEVLECIRNPRMRVVLCIASFWPIASEWDERWFPAPEIAVERHLDRSERVNLRWAALRLQSSEQLPFVAPWWHAPALAYWSGQPAVGGSSHEGIEGIRDSARIYLGTDPAKVRALLAERRVAVVVAGDRARIVENCIQLLGTEPEGRPLADVLWSADIPLEWGLHGESNVTMFRLVRVLP